MADYYSEYGGGRKGKSRRSVTMFVVDMVLSILTYMMAAVMALTFFAPYVNPSKVWFFPILGIGAPLVYIATVLLAFYWVIRWRWGRAGMMLLLVAIGFFKVSLFYKPDFKREYGAPSYDRSAFKVMTFNVRQFYADNGKSSAGEVLRLIGEQDPDIVCLQEYGARLAEQEESFALLDEKYESAVGRRIFAPDSVYDTPLVIYSKYRILRSGTVLPRESVWADIVMGDDTVRVFNNHLRSTAIKASDDDFITNHRYLSDTAREDKIRSMAQRFRANSVLRAGQVDSIAKVVNVSPYRRIVCGDFNDTPMSYVYRRMARGLTDAFSECGEGYSHTFRGFFNTLRIDYVLSSEGFETLSYEVPDALSSDHLPVVVRLKKTAINF